MAQQERIWRDLWRSGLLGRFLLLCLGVWLHAADSLISATIMPKVVADIGGLPFISWSLSLYECGSILSGAAAGLLVGRRGVRSVLLLGSLLFGAGCLLGTAAPSMSVLLIGRVAQGMGGGLLVSLSYVAIEQFFPPALWTRLIGVVSGIWGVGALLGPLIGGVLADAGLWRLAFLSFAAQAMLLAVAGLFMLPRDRPRRGTITPRLLPWPQLLVLMTATGALAEAGILHALVPQLLLGLAGTLLLYGAAWLDRISVHPLLPRGLLAWHTPLGAGLFATFALSAGTTSFPIYGPLLMERMMDTSSLMAGYVLAAESISWSIASILIASLPAAAAPKLIRLGALGIVCGIGGFAVAVPCASLIGIIASGILQGAGFGLCWPPLVARIITLAPARETALAANASSTVQRIGYAVGAAATGIAANAAGLAAEASQATVQEAGFWIFAAFAPLLLAGLVFAWRFSARDRKAPVAYPIGFQ